jgi:tRNA(Arg) A34 adenosine deaminase TadA
MTRSRIVTGGILDTVLPDWVFDDDDRRCMAAAMDEARRARDQEEVPVGAVVVHGGEIIARAGNRRRESGDPTAHAEVLAIRRAADVIGDFRLAGCTLYVTLEPCPMCVTTCRQARLELVIWGAADPRAGACGSIVDLADDRRLGPPLAHRGGLGAAESRELLEEFFAKRRRKS